VVEIAGKPATVLARLLRIFSSAFKRAEKNAGFLSVGWKS
jgi:hypothetical protein